MTVLLAIRDLELDSATLIVDYRAQSSPRTHQKADQLCTVHIGLLPVSVGFQHSRLWKRVNPAGTPQQVVLQPCRTPPWSF